MIIVTTQICYYYYYYYRYYYHLYYHYSYICPREAWLGWYGAALPDVRLLNRRVQSNLRLGCSLGKCVDACFPNTSGSSSFLDRLGTRVHEEIMETGWWP